MKDKSADGLRGLASLNVAITHFIGAFLPVTNFAGIFLPLPTPETQTPLSLFVVSESFSGFFNILASPFVSFFYSGRFAVFIFFVLSGYVLSMPYFEGNNDIILKKRLISRYLRLNIPIAISCFISYGLYKSGLYFNVPAANLSGSIDWLKLFFPPEISFRQFLNLTFYQSIMYGYGTLNPPLWTLKAEFIGSIYLLTYFIIRPEKFFLISQLVVLFFVYLLYGADSIYIFSMFLGSFINIVRINKKLNYLLVVIALILGATQMQGEINNAFPLILGFRGNEIWVKRDFYCTIGAFFLVVAVKNGFGKSVLRSSFCQFLGKISYPLYLIHFIILGSIACWLFIKLPPGGMHLFINFVTYLILCGSLGYLFYKWIDLPSIRISHLFSNRLYR
jgi:peptidoglycan/LPS O-acetylase OafA/YrhL